MKFRNILAATAAASLMVAPIAVQAGTPASSAIPTASRASTGVKHNDEFNGHWPIWLTLFVAAAAATGIAAAAGAFNKHCKSAGAC